jgi:ABC-2 type transport system permease protein
MVLVKPLPRPVFILAKFAALALMFALVMIVTALGAYYYTVILFSAPDFGAWMAATGLMWVQILVYIALTLLFSTLFRSQAAAAGLGFGVILLFALFSALPGLAPYIPDRLLAWGGSLFTPVPIHAWPAMAVSLGVILLSLVGAVAVFQKQEL